MNRTHKSYGPNVADHKISVAEDFIRLSCQSDHTKSEKELFRTCTRILFNLEENSLELKEALKKMNARWRRKQSNITFGIRYGDTTYNG